MITKFIFKQWLESLLKTTTPLTWQTIHEALCNNLFFENDFLHPNYNKVKGDIFEYLIKYVYISKGYTVYLYNEIPHELKKQLNLPNTDKGIDLIIAKDDIFIGIQCKWRNKVNNSIKKCYITEFLYAMKDTGLNYGILATNVQNITPTFDNNDLLKWYLNHDVIQDINDPLIQSIINETEPEKITQPMIMYDLRDYQKEAYMTLLRDRSKAKQCIMACGTGKTVVFIHYLKYKKVNKIVIALPSLHLVKQTYQNVRKTLGKTRNILCICSDLDIDDLTCGEAANGKELYNEYLASDYEKIFTTNINIIRRRISGKKIIVLTTYQSSGLLKDCEFDLGIFDEAHKTVNNEHFGFLLYDDNCKINERVFFTATPRYFKGKNEDVVSMCNENIYGKEVFCYPFKKAIENGYILDFKIVLYVAPEGLEELVYEKWITDNKLCINGDNVVATDFISAIQLCLHIKENKCVKRILTYHNTVNNAVRYTKVLKYVFEKYDIVNKVFVMSGSTKMKDRQLIFDEFEKFDGISVICSAKVLNEGVDIPCVDTVCFVDPRKSTIDVTQCVGRAMRLHDNMKECYVLIPVMFDKIDEKHNYKQVLMILAAMCELDDKIVEEFMIKGINNKIVVRNMENMVEFKDKGTILYDIKDIEEKLECKILSSRYFSNLNWDKRLEEIKKYIDDNKKLPSQASKNNKLISMANWLSLQTRSYKKYIYIMKNEIIRNKWESFIEEYKIYFISNEDIWKDNLNKVIKYIQDNNKRPSCGSHDINISHMGQWIQNQKNNYPYKKQIMKYDNIRKMWEDFLDEYNEYFITNTEIWENKLKDVIKYIQDNNKRPSCMSKDINTRKLGKWASRQNLHYLERKEIMQNENIRILWEQFLENYGEYFMETVAIWEKTLNQVIEYIKNNNKLPSSTSNDIDVKKIGSWLLTQKQNYLKLKNVMKNKDIQILWENFVENHSIYFKDNYDIWKNNLMDLIEYIKTNNKKPSSKSNDKNTEKLNRWLFSQKRNYKKNKEIMKNNEIRVLWEDFLKEYSIYFKESNEIWESMLNNVIEYIKTNQKRPSNMSSDSNIKQMAQWIQLQKRNYIDNKGLINQNHIKKLWEDFLKEYNTYIMSDEEKWQMFLNDTIEYIKHNNQKPKCSSTDLRISKLGNWITTQKSSYQNNKGLMKNNEIRKQWEDFLENNNKYLKSNEEIWIESLNNAINYIKTHNKKPSIKSNDKNLQTLAIWLSRQNKNYKNNIEIMKNENIRILWEDFIKKYGIYIRNKNEIWDDMLNNIINYIKENKKRPNSTSPDANIRQMGKWITRNKQTYREYTQIMKKEKTRQIWEAFTEEYKDYL